jgi:transposase InsO family protein
LNIDGIAHLAHHCLDINTWRSPMGRKRSIALDKDSVRSEKSSLLGRRPNAAELKEATWVVDQRRIDTFEGPVSFAAVVDKRSGYVLGWSVNDGAGTKSVREALRLAFRKRGECVSPKIHTDNGKEFSDPQWKALLRDLNLNQVMSPSYRSTNKADIERFFGKLNAEMFGLRWQPSLQGPNVPRVARARESSPRAFQTGLTLGALQAEVAEFIGLYNNDCGPLGNQGG